MKKFSISIISVFIALMLQGCQSPHYVSSTSSPKSTVKTEFPPLQDYWIIDTTGAVSSETILRNDQICQSLQDDGLAEMVVVIVKDVKDPAKWTTHYGRELKLGKKGRSTQGGNNGIVWLIDPSANNKLTISVGRGLPYFTSVDYGKIMKASIDYVNFGNYNRGIDVLVGNTNKFLRENRRTKK